MSEMLGNHYFLVRNYEAAIKAFETAFSDKLPGKTIKKLIICHLVNNNFETAKQLFLKLLKEDPQIIVKTDIKKEDCPCPELISDYESRLSSSITLFDVMRLAILWLYCDVDESIKYFIKMKEITPQNSFVDDVIHIINSLINKTNKKVY